MNNTNILYVQYRFNLGDEKDVARNMKIWKRHEIIRIRKRK